MRRFSNVAGPSNHTVNKQSNKRELELTEKSPIRKVHAKILAKTIIDTQRKEELDTVLKDIDFDIRHYKLSTTIDTTKYDTETSQYIIDKLLEKQYKFQADSNTCTIFWSDEVNKEIETKQNKFTNSVLSEIWKEINMCVSLKRWAFTCSQPICPYMTVDTFNDIKKELEEYGYEFRMSSEQFKYTNNTLCSCISTIASKRIVKFTIGIPK